MVCILITSCDRDRNNGRNNAVRNTWARAWCARGEQHPILDYRFVLGRTCENPRDDEIIVDADDSYGATSIKQHRGYLWALSHGHRNVFQCDVDTYVAVPRLLTTEWPLHDYIGRQDDPRGFCGGGCGYWLTARALRVLAVSEPYPEYGDLWVGTVLQAAGIKAHHDPRFWTKAYSEPRFDYGDFSSWEDGTCAVHLGRGTDNYDPAWMLECHACYCDYVSGR